MNYTQEQHEQLEKEMPFTRQEMEKDFEQKSDGISKEIHELGDKLQELGNTWNDLMDKHNNVIKELNNGVITIAEFRTKMLQLAYQSTVHQMVILTASQHIGAVDKYMNVLNDLCSKYQGTMISTLQGMVEKPNFLEKIKQLFKKD